MNFSRIKDLATCIKKIAQGWSLGSRQILKVDIKSYPTIPKYCWKTIYEGSVDYWHYMTRLSRKIYIRAVCISSTDFLSISNHKQIFKSQTHMNIIKVVLDIYQNCLGKGSPRKLLNLPRSFPQFRHLAVII